MSAGHNVIHETLNSFETLHSNATHLASKFSNVLNVLKEAQEANNQYISCSNKSINTITEHSTWNNYTEGDTLFITVKSPLNSDGTFWFRVWNKDFEFDDDQSIDKISEKLGWMEKECTAVATAPKPSSTPVFFFSNNKKCYYRAVITKVNNESSVNVRYLDLGKYEDVSTDVQFYLVPFSILKKFPIKCAQGSIFDNAGTLSYEVKWQFNDLTHNEVLLAKVEDCTNTNNQPCYRISLRSLAKGIDVTKEIRNKIAEIQIEAEEKQREKQNVIQKDKVGLSGSLHDLSNRQIPLATVEPVQVKERNSSLKSSKDSAERKNVEFNEPECKQRSRKDSESRERDSTQQSNDGNRNRVASMCSNDTESEPPTRSNSLDSVLMAKRSKNKSKRKSKKKKSTGHHSDTECTDPKDDRSESMRSSAKRTCDTKPESASDWIDKIPMDERQKVPNVIPNLMNLFYSATQLRSEPWWEIELMNINKLLQTQARLTVYCFDIFLSQLKNALKYGHFDFGHCEKPWVYNAKKELAERSSCSTQYVIFREYTPPHGNSQGPRNHRVVGIARVDDLPTRGRYPITFLSLSRFKTTVSDMDQPVGGPFSTLSLDSAKRILVKMQSTLANNQRSPTFPDYFPWCGIPPVRKEFRKPISKKQTKPQQSYSQMRSSGARSPTLFYDESRSIVSRIESLPHATSERSNSRAQELEEMWAEDDWDDEKPKTPSQMEDLQKSPTTEPEIDVLPSHQDSGQNNRDPEIEAETKNTQAVQLKPDSSPQQKEVISKSEIVHNCEEKIAQPNDDESTPTEKPHNNHLHRESRKNDETSKPPNQENGFYDASGIWYPSIMAKMVADTITSVSADACDVNQNHINAGTAFRILQRPKSQEGPVNLEHALSVLGMFDSSKKPLDPIGTKRVISKTSSLSAASSVSELAMEERFERNCKTFDISSEDFE